MKRLIKKSKQDSAIVSVNPSFMPMSELDEADIKNDRCPACKTQESLQKIDGFKKCPSCGNTFKMFDGDGYTVVK
jgi:ribosomal protein L37AE/L43A